MATAASNTIKVHTMFAEEALEVLENELQLGSLVWRSLEQEFSKEPNGYKIGQTIKVKKPPKYAPTSGAAITAFQDTAEEEVSLTVDQRWKVPVQFGTQELTQDLTNFRERVVKPAVVPLSDKIDDSIADLYDDLHHAVGTAGTTMATFEDMQKIDTRLVQIAAPKEKRCAIFDPDNYAGLVSGAKAHFEQSIVRDALKDNYLGRYSNIDTFRSVHVKSHTGGAWAGAPAIDGASQSGATLAIKDFTASTTVKKGDIFTIADVYDVNPINKQAYSYLKQFVVTADAAADGSGDIAALAISPSIVTSGAKQNVSAGPADGALLVINSGTGTNAHIANFAITRQTFALACVPLVDAGGGAISTTVSSKSEGLSIRMVEYYDGDNDFTNTRLDILFGTATMYAETGVRVYG
jgi:hypothetical protein